MIIIYSHLETKTMLSTFRLLSIASILVITSCSKREDTSGSGTTPITSDKPVIITTPITNLYGTSVVAGGNITSDGGFTVTHKGVIWANASDTTNFNTTVATNGNGAGTAGKTDEFSNGTIGSFASKVGDYSYLTPILKQNTKYFLKAYATNSKGTSYGETISFTTTFDTVKIGSQIWMKFNLDVTVYNTGSPISGPISDANTWLTSNNLSTGYFCLSQDGKSNLYNGFTISNLAPAGWHIPTEQEWSILISTTTADKMKVTTGWNPNTGTNASGFSAIPTGYKNENGTFVGSIQNAETYFWVTNGKYVELYNNVLVVNQSLTPSIKKRGYSVRCLKN